jgi:hypothetical protein
MFISHRRLRRLPLRLHLRHRLPVRVRRSLVVPLRLRFICGDATARLAFVCHCRCACVWRLCVAGRCAIAIVFAIIDASARACVRWSVCLPLRLRHGVRVRRSLHLRHRLRRVRAADVRRSV